ncbi:MAG: O-antigen ligase family protein [Gloeobacterales cyanobacterium]
MLTMTIPHSKSALWIGIAGVLFGILAGMMVGAQPLFVGLLLGAIAALVYFFTNFERAVLGLLVVRSALDIFAAQQIPSLYAVGVDSLTLLYVVILLLTSKAVKTDRFWWFFASWIALQGIWLVLMPLGGLGLDASYIGNSLREWARLFSWLMVYLLVMQLKGRVPPEKVISILFFTLLIPLAVAFLQTVAPSILPPLLSGTSLIGQGAPIDQGSRIRGPFVHSNVLATYLLLFMSLTWWKLTQAKKRWPWLLLMGILAFFFVGTKALFSLMMLAVFVFVLITFRANMMSIFGGVFLFALVIALFSSTEFGQQRLSSLLNTPILNPDFDISRAILSAKSDYNSFNWRLSQWSYLLGAWQNYPYLGYGLGTSIYVSTNNLLPHNDYVRALVEGGILGFSTFVFFLVAQVMQLTQHLRRLPKESSQRSLCTVLFALLMAIPVGMFTENIWSHTTFFFYWWTLFAVAGWSWNEQSPKDEFIPSKILPVSRMKEYGL